jgi:predicted MFS family arabinose efflux permease
MAQSDGSPSPGSAAISHDLTQCTDKPSPPEVEGRRWPRALAALSHRNYRLFFVGQLISVTGMWIQSVAHGWLVVRIAPDEQRAFLVGLVSAMGALPVLLFTLMAGVLADRVPKRSLVVATQTAAMLLAFTLAGLTHWGLVNIWWVIVVAFASGTVNAFDIPTRQSLVVDMVGKQDLANAIALNSAMFNLARIGGPAIAGLVIAAVGTAGAFSCNGVSYLAVIAGLLMMRIPPHVRRSREEPGGGLREGLRYVARHRLISALLLHAAAVSIFGASYGVLMPVFVHDVLAGDAATLGYLMSAVGLGALAGALTLSTVDAGRNKGKLLLTGTLALAGGVIAFSFTRTLPFSLAALPLVGWGVMTTMASTNTLLQLAAPDEMRGRVMSAYTLSFMGMSPFGGLQAGALAQVLGVARSLPIGALVCAVSAGLLGARIVRGAALMGTAKAPPSSAGSRVVDDPIDLGDDVPRR